MKKRMIDFVYRVLFLLLLVSIGLRAGNSLKYDTYVSDDFQLSIPYPPNVFVPQGEVIKRGLGRGQLFISKKFDAELVVSGYNTKFTIAELFKNTLDKLKQKTSVKVTYKKLKHYKNWYVVSGHDNNGKTIFYHRIHLDKNKVKQFSLIYPSKNKKALDDIVKTISYGFKVGSKYRANTYSSNTRSKECSTPMPNLACSPSESRDKAFAMCAMVMGGCEVAMNELSDQRERYAMGQTCGYMVSELSGEKYDIDAMLNTFFLDSVGDLAKAARESDNALVNIFFGIPLSVTELASKAAQLDQCVLNAKKNCTYKYVEWKRNCR